MHVIHTPHVKFEYVQGTFSLCYFYIVSFIYIRGEIKNNQEK